MWSVQSLTVGWSVLARVSSTGCGAAVALGVHNIDMQGNLKKRKPDPQLQIVLSSASGFYPCHKSKARTKSILPGI